MVVSAKEFRLHEPDFTFKNNKEFVMSMNKCIDYLNWTTASDQRIPRDIIVAMAIVESAYGTSRFAQKVTHYLVLELGAKMFQMKSLAIS